MKQRIYTQEFRMRASPDDLWLMDECGKIFECKNRTETIRKILRFIYACSLEANAENHKVELDVIDVETK